MKNIKRYLEYITEKKANKAEVYNKFYTDIDPKIYNQIVSADPSSKGDSIGLYTQWLLDLYKNKKLKLEDLYKATEYLQTFKEFHGKIGRKDIKDLSGINSLHDLFTIVEPFLHKEDAHFSNEEERALVGQFKQVYKNKKYRIIIPLTLKASQYFGQDTEWCTTNTDQFEHYTKNQNPNNLNEECLYILYTEDPEERLQFSFSTRQFMNIEDYQIDIKEFFEENEDIKEFFNTLFNIDIYTELPDEIIMKYSSKYNLRIELVELMSSTYDSLEQWKEDNEDWEERFDIVTTDFSYDEHPMDSSMTMEFEFIFNSKESYDKFEKMLEDIYKKISIKTEVEYGYASVYANIG